MQNFFTIANADGDFMKFIFIGVWILFVLGGVVSKMRSLNKQGDNANAPQKPRSSARGANSNSEDMARARRRLQEMIREREAQGGFFEQNFPEPKEVFAPQESYEAEQTPLQTQSIKPKLKENASDTAYAQNAFDYDTQLKASQKLLRESEIAYNKVAKSALQTEQEESILDIKATEIRDFVHNKAMLKKSIIISEVLDKPLSLR